MLVIELGIDIFHIQGTRGVATLLLAHRHTLAIDSDKQRL